jgi:hypothetical protein
MTPTLPLEANPSQLAYNPSQLAFYAAPLLPVVRNAGRLRRRLPTLLGVRLVALRPARPADVVAHQFVLVTQI